MVLRISTTPTRIDIEPDGVELPTWHALMVVPDEGNTVYLGDSEVNTTTGLPIIPLDVYNALLGVDERGLYAVVASGTQDLILTLFGRGL